MVHLYKIHLDVLKNLDLLDFLQYRVQILLAQILSGKDVSSRYLVLCTCAAPQRRMGATASIEDEGGVADDKDYDKDSDKVVIQELYDCTQGAFWHNYSGWGTGAHVRSW